LLLPFLENAFKHGTSTQIDQCWISFNITMEEAIMKFKLVNSIDPVSEESDNKTGGLGLENVTRRLQLLYKDNFQLESQKMDEVFVVDLNITLEKLEEKFTEKLQLT